MYSLQTLAASEPRACEKNRLAKRTIEKTPYDPLFVADWAQPVFLHFSMNPDVLQPSIPFPLCCRDGKAYLSLVAFTMRSMRFYWGGAITKWMTRPIASHCFLNLRTYVKYGNNCGIYFVSEWLNNRISQRLGPITFGLPYRFARHDYRHDYEAGRFEGIVDVPKGGEFRYSCEIDSAKGSEACPSGSIDEFLLERYVAFTSTAKKKRYFRVWHEPWSQMPLRNASTSGLEHIIDPVCGEKVRLAMTPAGGNTALDAKNVWMGRPHSIAKMHSASSSQKLAIM